MTVRNRRPKPGHEERVNFKCVDGNSTGFATAGAKVTNKSRSQGAISGTGIQEHYILVLCLKKGCHEVGHRSRGEKLAKL